MLTQFLVEFMQAQYTEILHRLDHIGTTVGHLSDRVGRLERSTFNFSTFIYMKNKPLLFTVVATVFFAVLACFGQTTTFRADSIAPKNWQITTVTTYLRPDSSVYQTSASERFKSRKDAARHVRETFAPRIVVDSANIEALTRNLAGLRVAYAALLFDLGKDKPKDKQGKEAVQPAPVPPEPQKSKKKKTKN